jgi:hypothetical protein
MAEVRGGVLEANAGNRDGWESFGVPMGGSEYAYLMVGMGEPGLGPKITILHSKPVEADAFVADPSKTEDWEEGVKRGTHYHRTDMVRFQFAEGQSFRINRELYNFGDYYLQHACTPYFDPGGAMGMMMFQTEADRRGTIGQEVDTKDLRGDAFIERFPERYHDTVMLKLGTAHDEDSKAIRGSAISTGATIPRAGLKGSMFDTDDWTELSDGSRICVIVQGDPVSGPLMLLSHNAPGAVEAPAGTYGSDMMRAILRGTCSVGGHTQAYQAVRFVEAGVPETDVVHGSDGSTQFLYFADRRGWRSSGSDDTDTRAAEIAELVERTTNSVVVSTP